MNPLEKPYDEVYSRKESYRGHYSKSSYLKVWQEVAKNINSEDRVIDLGCGTGQVMELLLDKGIKQFIGYDFSTVAVELANNRVAGRNAKVEYRDLYELEPLPDADVYIACEVMEHIKNDIEVLSLIPLNKKVILTVPNYLGGSHVRKFNTEDEVTSRYASIIKQESITTVKYGNGKIFVLVGNRI
jgi:SAM-dependent methyltransferase